MTGAGAVVRTARVARGATIAADIPLFAEWTRRGHPELEMLMTHRYGLYDIYEGTTNLMGGRIRGREVLTLDEAAARKTH